MRFVVLGGTLFSLCLFFLLLLSVFLSISSGAVAYPRADTWLPLNFIVFLFCPLLLGSPWTWWEINQGPGRFGSRHLEACRLVGGIDSTAACFPSLACS
jgi:hypothetical protein